MDGLQWVPRAKERTETNEAAPGQGPELLPTLLRAIQRDPEVQRRVTAYLEEMRREEERARGGL